MPATHSTSRPDLCRKRSVGQLRQRFQSTAMQEVSLDVWNMEICWFSIYVQSGQDQSRRQQRDALSCLNISTGTDAMCSTAIAGKGRKRPQKPGHPEGPAARTPAGERPAPPGAEAGPQGWLETALQQTKRRGTRGLGGAPRHGIAARSCLSTARPAAPSATGAVGNKRERQRTKKAVRAPAAPHLVPLQPLLGLAPQRRIPRRALRCHAAVSAPAAAAPLPASAARPGPGRAASPPPHPLPGRGQGRAAELSQPRRAARRGAAPEAVAAALPWSDAARVPTRDLEGSGAGRNSARAVRGDPCGVRSGSVSTAPRSCAVPLRTAFPERRPPAAPASNQNNEHPLHKSSQK